MVAVSLVSVSALGLASLQVAAKRAGHEALQRTTAANLAMDIMARMRANPQALQRYARGSLGGGSLGSEPQPDCGKRATSCTPLQLAAHDLWQWEQALDGAAETRVAVGRRVQVGGLLAPTACIRVAAGAVTVAIAWAAFRELSDPQAHRCGVGSGRYGPADARRQLLLLHSFVGTG